MLNLQKGSLQPRLSYEGKHTLSDPCFISGLFSSVFIPGLSSGGITLQCRRSGHHQQEAIEFNSESCREFNQSKLWEVQRVQLVETLGTLESSTSGNSGNSREFNSGNFGNSREFNQWKLWELQRVQLVETLGNCREFNKWELWELKKEASQSFINKYHLHSKFVH